MRSNSAPTLSSSLSQKSVSAPQRSAVTRLLSWFGRGSLHALALIGASISLLACTGEQATDNTLQVGRAYVVVPAGASPAVMYFTVHNGTGQADTLTKVTSSLSDNIEMHEEMKHTAESGPPVEMVHMMPVSAVPVASHSDVHFAPGGKHVMINSPKQPIVAGDSIALTFHFAKAGTLEKKAAVITYSDVDTAVAQSGHSR